VRRRQWSRDPEGFHAVGQGGWFEAGKASGADSAVKSARLIKGAKEIYYPGAPHGLTATHQDLVNADLLAFLRS